MCFLSTSLKGGMLWKQNLKIGQCLKIAFGQELRVYIFFSFFFFFSSPSSNWD